MGKKDKETGKEKKKKKWEEEEKQGGHSGKSHTGTYADPEAGPLYVCVHSKGPGAGLHRAAARRLLHHGERRNHWCRRRHRRRGLDNPVAIQGQRGSTGARWGGDRRALVHA
jgi:hypothetical protein